jgi:hypothetical protein
MESRDVEGPAEVQKGVLTGSTLLASDWVVHRLNIAGFRMFSRVPSECKAGNAVRVPPRARKPPRKRGFLLSTS